MTNTYTIEGLKVPYIEGELTVIRNELSALRILLDAAVQAITRLDADVATLVDMYGAAHDE
jgi:hypothetical protein